MIPTYDCAGYLRQTLASVLAQDPGPEHMQIEVVDDASSDDPQAVVDELGAGRVSFFRQPANVGHTANFNTCLQRSRGQLVHLLHGDDAVRPGFYDAMGRAFTEHPDVGAAFCRAITVDRDGHWQRIGRLLHTAAGPLQRAPERLLAHRPVQAAALVARRDAYLGIGGFRASDADATEVCLRLAAGHRVWHEPRPLALRRVRPGSLGEAAARTGADVRQVHRSIRAMRDDAGRAAVRAARRECGERALETASALLGAGDPRGAAAQLREGLVADPPALGRAALLAAVHRISDGALPTPAVRPRPNEAPPSGAHRATVAPVAGGVRPPAVVGDDPDLRLRGLPAPRRWRPSWPRTQAPSTCRSRSSTTPPPTTRRPSSTSSAPAA